MASASAFPLRPSRAHRPQAANGQRRASSLCTTPTGRSGSSRSGSSPNSMVSISFFVLSLNRCSSQLTNTSSRRSPAIVPARHLPRQRKGGQLHLLRRRSARPASDPARESRRSDTDHAFHRAGPSARLAGVGELTRLGSGSVGQRVAGRCGPIACEIEDGNLKSLRTKTLRRFFPRTCRPRLSGAAEGRGFSSAIPVFPLPETLAGKTLAATAPLWPRRGGKKSLAGP